MLTRAWESGWLSDNLFNHIFELTAKFDIQIAWEFYHGMWTFGVDSPTNVLREMKKYSLHVAGAKKYLQQVTCPVLITGAADTIYWEPELSTELIFADLNHIPDEQKKMWIAKGVGYGGQQAKIGAMSIAHQKMFAWLDQQFDIKRASSLGLTLSGL